MSVARMQNAKCKITSKPQFCILHLAISLSSVRSFPRNHYRDRPEQNAQIHAGGPVLGVEDVEPHHLVERGITAPQHLPQAGNTGRYFHPPPLPLRVAYD